MKLLQVVPIPRIRRRKTTLPSPGAAPGTLTPATGAVAEVRITRCVYGDGHHETSAVDPTDIAEAVAPQPGLVVWVDVQGLGDLAMIRRAGNALGLHPLTLEDIVHVHQRAKVDEFEDHLFLVLRALRLLDDGQADNEQVSMVLRPGVLVTFQERAGDGFDPVRRRIREGKGGIRRNGADYLLYALVDAIIDNYFPALEAYDETMDRLDEQVRDNPTPAVSQAIHLVRRELRLLRRAAGPLREMAGQLARDELELISEPARIALRDCFDHALHASEFVEGARERAADLADLYLVMVGERTNRVMQLLTIIATIFIPLTFLCGLYGMNFDPDASPYNMPELKWRYGYPAFWAALMVILVGMLWYFRRKGWLGQAQGASRGPST